LVIAHLKSNEEVDAMLRTAKHPARLSLAIAVLAPAVSVGCGSGAGEPAGGATENPSGTASSRLLFEDVYSNTGHFRVYEDEPGRLGLSIDGKIGVDDMVDVGRHIERSLVATYMSLRPELASPPDALIALEKRYSPTILSPAPTAKPAATRGGVTPLSFDSFVANACQNLYAWTDGSPYSHHCTTDYFYPSSCFYWNNWNEACTSYSYADQSAGWNVDSEQGALHELKNPSTGQYNYGRFIVAGYWQWDSWGAGAPYTQVCMKTYSTVSSLGVTDHKYTSPCWNDRDACRLTCDPGDEDCNRDCDSTYDACCHP
jgi:hypothetical protein